jgi:CDGSH iron-sulfur domain-containing protein 3
MVENVKAAAATVDGDAVPTVEIKVRDDGPYKVTGPVRLVDADGNEFELAEGKAIALCRCGASETKPFCDRAHRECGFASRERAAAPADDGNSAT